MLTRSYSTRKVEKTYRLVKTAPDSFISAPTISSLASETSSQTKICTNDLASRGKVSVCNLFSSQHKFFRSLQAVYRVPRRSNRRRLAFLLHAPQVVRHAARCPLVDKPPTFIKLCPECVTLMFGVTTPKNFKISASDEALSNLLITTRFTLMAGLDWRFLMKLCLNFPLAFFAHPSLLSRRPTSRPTEIL